jgi:hypothetical protein
MAALLRILRQRLWPSSLLLPAVYLFLFIPPVPSYSEDSSSPLPELPYLRRAYPDVGFRTFYDAELGDWVIHLSGYGREAFLCWAGGRFILPNQRDRQEDFRKLIYPFPVGVYDPELLSPEQIEWISRFGSTENRRNAAIANMSFYDFLYDCATEEAAVSHMITVSFLGKSVTVHERIAPVLGRVEEKIRRRAGSEPDVADFIRDLASAGGFAWRGISDTRGRSFHSMGLAVDLLPRGWRNRKIYWNWEKNKGNPGWMMIPVEERWMPPLPVVEAFEEEGFIWGGKWPVWDNMHFEYRPELILGRAMFRTD